MWNRTHLGDGLNLIEGPGGLRIELQHPVYVDIHEDGQGRILDAGAFKLKTIKSTGEKLLFVVSSCALIEIPLPPDAYSMIAGCMVEK